MPRTELVEVFEAAVTQYLAELDDREFAVLVARVRTPGTVLGRTQTASVSMNERIDQAYAEIRRQRDILVTAAVVHGVDASMAGRYADDLLEVLAHQMFDGALCAVCGGPELTVGRVHADGRSEVRIDRGCDC